MWHVSIAKINSTGTAIVPVTLWPGAVTEGALALQRRILIGRGQSWERAERGDMAVHLRRRLSAEEMALLFRVKPAAPVFTHGCALKAMVEVKP